MISSWPLCATRPEEIFGRPAVPAVFPLLIKLLDADGMLSVQVHPSDRVAAKLGTGELGKTEAWVVLEALPEGRIYAGLLPGITHAELERHLAAGTVDRCLHSFTPRAGDCPVLAGGHGARCRRRRGHGGRTANQRHDFSSL